MHPEIDKMVKMAQSRGSISTVQRDMILNKARELGDDPMEVEFILSGLAISDTTGAQSANQSGPNQSQQQYAYQQPRPAYAPQQQQQFNNGATMPGTSNKTSLLLGIGSTVIGVVGFASAIIALLGLAAGIFGLIRSKKEKAQFSKVQGPNIKNPFQTAFVLSIIGVAISGLAFLAGLAGSE